MNQKETWMSVNDADNNFVCFVRFIGSYLRIHARNAALNLGPLKYLILSQTITKGLFSAQIVEE